VKKAAIPPSPAPPARPNPPPDLTAFLLEVSDAVSGTLDLDQVLSRASEIVKRIVDFEIFAILLVNERSEDMRIRFAVGHLPEVVDSVRVKIGEGITGQAAATRQPQLSNDVRENPHYIHAIEGIQSELAVPIVWKKRLIGVIDIQSHHLGAFQPEHVQALVLIANRIASAIENARLYRNAVTRERTLAVLNDISRELASILTLDDLLKRTAEMVHGVIDYQLFSILLLNAAGDALEHRLSVKFGQNVQLKHRIPLGRGITGAAALSRTPIVVADVTQDERYVAINPEVLSEMAVPLIHQGQVIGVLDLEHTKRGYYRERHARTLSTLAAPMAMAIANARLYEQVARAERRMERDLHFAQVVQRHLLPPECPQLPGLELAATSVPARELGGDLYDFLPYKNQRLAIAVGDVSGKGAAAALYGAVVSGILRTQAALQLAPGELLKAVNAALVQRKIEAQFVTLIYALWSERSRRLTIANSGLPYPVHCTATGCHQVRIAGIPLGMLEDPEYDEVTLQMKPGEVVAFVSDGITEFMNHAGEEFGRTRLEHTLRQHAHESAQAIVDAIVTDAEQFGAGLRASDDRSVVVLKVR